MRLNVSKKKEDEEKRKRKIEVDELARKRLDFRGRVLVYTATRPREVYYSRRGCVISPRYASRAYER